MFEKPRLPGASRRTPAIRLTTMQACISEARTPRILQPCVRFSTGGACRRRTACPGGRWGRCHGPWAPFSGPGACAGGSRLWLPVLRLVFQKGHLAAKIWWAQVGSNHRHLACKAEYGQEYAQLAGPAHASELRKPCPEMPSGAWESLHGGSRKWFPGQFADPSLKERV